MGKNSFMFYSPRATDGGPNFVRTLFYFILFDVIKIHIIIPKVQQKLLTDLALPEKILINITLK